MFTGLIQDVGRVRRVQPGDASATLTLETRLAGEPFRLGESLAVNGACLTVVGFGADRVSVTAVDETLRRTTLGALRAGDRVNLERPLALGGRLDGHLVQGHVDGVGTVRELRAEGDSHRLVIALPDPLAPHVVPKGSISVDGVSLTVAALERGRVEVAVIPHTWVETTLSRLSSGHRVNLETDIIGKYVARLLGAYQGSDSQGGLSVEKLAELGFM